MLNNDSPSSFGFLKIQTNNAENSGLIFPMMQKKILKNSRKHVLLAHFNFWKFHSGWTISKWVKDLRGARQSPVMHTRSTEPLISEPNWQKPADYSSALSNKASFYNLAKSSGKHSFCLKDHLLLDGRIWGMGKSGVWLEKEWARTSPGTGFSLFYFSPMLHCA